MVMMRLTHEEHHARAMLLGMEYDWRDGTYINDAENCTYFCCVTLEEVTPTQCYIRLTSRLGNSRWPSVMSKPTLPPWEPSYDT